MKVLDFRFEPMEVLELVREVLGFSGTLEELLQRPNQRGERILYEVNELAYEVYRDGRLVERKVRKIHVWRFLKGRKELARVCLEKIYER